MSRKISKSSELQKRAEQVIPGGVNSPVRAFRAVGGEPVFIARGEGAHIWDADGNQYIDYLGSWGPLILGHAFPQVVEAIMDAATKGASFGASTPAEVELAELVVGAIPAIEKIRFVSSEPKPLCPPSGWRGLSPNANTSSSLKAATTVTQMPCW